MNTNNEEFLKRLLSTFRIEAQEHLNVISSRLTEMGKVDSAKQAEIVETVYREAHSLKGGCPVGEPDRYCICLPGNGECFFRT